MDNRASRRDDGNHVRSLREAALKLFRKLPKALVALLAWLVFFAIARGVRADPPPPSSPGRDAILAGEDSSTQSSVVPALDEAATADLLGRPVHRVDVAIVGGRFPASVSVTSVRIGEPFAPEQARRLLREALANGGVARAAIDVLPDGDGVRLIVNVLPRRVVATVQIHDGVLEPNETLEAAHVNTGSEVTATLLPRIAERIRQRYVQRGYPAAHVSVDTSETDDPEKVIVAVYIKAGAPTNVAQRVFVIDPRADREVGDLKRDYKVERGARLDEVALGDADRDLTESLKKHSFFRADVRHATRTIGSFGYIYIYLNPGPRILPVFDGNRAFDKDQLSKALELEKAPEWKTTELVDRLRTFYLMRGFIDVEISAVERGRPDDPIHYLAFTVHEEPQAKVSKRIFPCLAGKAFSADDLGREIDSYLEDELPGSDLFSVGSPRAIDAALGPTDAGNRALVVDLNPNMTYAPATYERALKHLKDLVHSKGYLNAVVGPVSIVRATCNKYSPPGQCLPDPLPEPVHARCLVDAVGLPLPEPALPEADSCRPDPVKGITCSPDITLRIPVHLGPATTLYDLAFEGNSVFDGKVLAKVSELLPGDPVSNQELEGARQKVLDHYRNDGFAYAEVRFLIEPSPDRTRARVRFYVTERDRVIVSGFVVHGNTRTSTSLILGRLDLKLEQPYRQNWVRLSEEQIATLGTFASVSIALEDPEVPQKRKRVVITVAEQVPQYLDPLIGFSSGDGIRFAIEYGHRNIGGVAVSVILRVQLSYIFDFMILDPDVKRNYDTLSVSERLERRDTISFVFPEVGLGPRVSMGVDAIDVRDNERDFGITKEALVPSITYRPRRTLTTQLSASAELNDVDIFNTEDLNTTISLLRAPEGRTVALAQRASFTWDGRDNPFAATRGVLLAGSVEHVNAFPSGLGTTGDPNPATITSHFLKFTGKVNGYVRLTKKGTAIALSLAAGYNFQLNSKSETYPDRLFFLGGVDTMRDFLEDSQVPEDIAKKIEAKQFTIDDVVLRGGDFFINPRAELRVPVNETFGIGLFLDSGNLWVDPKNIDLLELRYGAGAGLRIATPIGPIALDYGINLDRRSWEDFGAFHFSIGLF